MKKEDKTKELTMPKVFCKNCKNNIDGFCDYWEDYINRFAKTQCTAFDPVKEVEKKECCGGWTGKEYSSIFSCCKGECKCHTPPVPAWGKRLRQLPQLYKASKADISAIEDFISLTLKQQKEEMVNEIMTLINREIAIAHTKDKGGKTSRLTSLAMKVSNLKN